MSERRVVDRASHSDQPVELSPAWQAEIARRLERIERGDAVIHADAREVVRRLRDEYG